MITKKEVEIIKRLSYFDGQFLREDDFRHEQDYHRRTRRWMNYILFKKGGIIPLDSNSLEIDITDTAGKQFRVTAGMAIALNHNDREGKEIVLEEPTGSITVSGGQNVVVTLHYSEEAVQESSEGSKTGFTRMQEKAVIEVYENIGQIPDTGNDEYIILGELDTASMKLTANSESIRQKAEFRSELLGVAPVNLVSFEVVPAAVTIEQNATRQLTARGKFSDGSHRDLTTGDGLTWESSDTSKATVDENGLVTGIAIGSATITASAKGEEATATVEVVASAPELLSIDISPASITMQVGGEPVTFTATGNFSGGAPSQPLTAADGLVWSSSDTNIVEIEAATGLATAKSGGTATITAEAQGKSNTVSVTVNPAVPTPIFLTGIDGTKGSQLDPHGGVDGTGVSIYGRNFSVDSPTLPTVELIKDAAVVHVFEVISVTPHKSPGGIDYEVIEARVQTVTSEDIGNIRVTTSGGSADSTETFALTIM